VTCLTYVPPRRRHVRGRAPCRAVTTTGRCSHRAAASLISPLASLTVSLTLCNFAVLARAQTAPLELRTFIELAAAEPGLAVRGPGARCLAVVCRRVHERDGAPRCARADARGSCRFGRRAALCAARSGGARFRAACRRRR